jgi:hypothetical protein
MAAMAVLDQGMDLPVTRSMPASKLTLPWPAHGESRQNHQPEFAEFCSQIRLSGIARFTLGSSL